MISPDKLFQIEGGQRRRKLALCFGEEKNKKEMK